MESSTQKEINKIIKLYFNTPQVLYNHLFSSYHQFIEEIIPYSLINEQNYFYSNMDNDIIVFILIFSVDFSGYTWVCFCF